MLQNNATSVILEEKDDTLRNIDYNKYLNNMSNQTSVRNTMLNQMNSKK